MSICEVCGLVIAPNCPTKNDDAVLQPAVHIFDIVDGQILFLRAH